MNSLAVGPVAALAFVVPFRDRGRAPRATHIPKQYAGGDAQGQKTKALGVDDILPARLPGGRNRPGVDALLPVGDDDDQLEELDPDRLRTVVRMLKLVAQDAHRKHSAAEEALMLKQEELQRFEVALNAVTRYAEDLEEEVDQTRLELDDLRARQTADATAVEELLQQRETDLSVWIEVLKETEDALQRRRERMNANGKAGASALAEGNRPLLEMSEEELQAECSQRGLSHEGSLAALRMRLRAARARERAGATGSSTN